jgi:hypothetical protein
MAQPFAVKRASLFNSLLYKFRAPSSVRHGDFPAGASNSSAVAHVTVIMNSFAAECLLVKGTCHAFVPQLCTAAFRQTNRVLRRPGHLWLGVEECFRRSTVTQGAHHALTSAVCTCCCCSQGQKVLALAGAVRTIRQMHELDVLHGDLKSMQVSADAARGSLRGYCGVL